MSCGKGMATLDWYWVDTRHRTRTNIQGDGFYFSPWNREMDFLLVCSWVVQGWNGYLGGRAFPAITSLLIRVWQLLLPCSYGTSWGIIFCVSDFQGCFQHWDYRSLVGPLYAIMMFRYSFICSFKNYIGDLQYMRDIFFVLFPWIIMIEKYPPSGKYIFRYQRDFGLSQLICRCVCI